MKQAFIKTAIVVVPTLLFLLLSMMVNSGARKTRTFKYDLSKPIEKNLATATLNVDLDFIKDYVEKNPDKINADIWAGQPLLHRVVAAIAFPDESGKVFRQRQIKLIEYLLKKGADINQHDNRMGGTPLHAVAFHPTNNLAIFKLLLKHGADPKSRAQRKSVTKTPWGVVKETRYNTSVLEVAAANGHWKMVEILLKAGAPVTEEVPFTSFPERKGTRSAILRACKQELPLIYRDKEGYLYGRPRGVRPPPAPIGNKKVLSLLLKEIKDINEIKGFGNVTALHVALHRGFPQRAKFLLEKCPNLDASAHSFKGTPLEIVAKSTKLSEKQKTEMTQLLKAHIEKYKQRKLQPKEKK